MYFSYLKWPWIVLVSLLLVLPARAFVIATSIPYLKEITDHVVCHDSRVTVASVLPYGTDPHTFVPNFSSAVLLEKATLVFGLGLHLDERLVQSRHLKKGANLFFVAQENSLDIHVWQSVSKTIEITRRIALILQTQHVVESLACAEAYVQSLQETKNQIQGEMNTVLPLNRVLIVSHNSFSYFTQTYGWENKPLSQSFTEETQASWKSLEQILGFLKNHPGVRSVFAEYGDSNKALYQLARAAGVKVAESPLYGDNLMSTGLAHTVSGLWLHNAQIIVAGLR